LDDGRSVCDGALVSIDPVSLDLLCGRMSKIEFGGDGVLRLAVQALRSRPYDCWA
jgi:hypothetical protein